jgi:hypothetical protein
MIAILAFTFIAAGAAQAGRADKELDKKFEEVRKQQVVTSMTTSEAVEILKKDQTSLQKMNLLLDAISKVQDDPTPERLVLLRELHQRHQKLTFQNSYGDNAKFVRGIDYKRRLCELLAQIIARWEQVLK